MREGWLEWTPEQFGHANYVAGRKLLKYINQEITATKQIATTEQVFELDARKAEADDVNDLKARMNAIEEAVNKLMRASEPPETPEKRSERLKATSRLGKLTNQRIN